MIQITPQMRILVAVEPVDFRKGIDGLAAMITFSRDQSALVGEGGSLRVPAADVITYKLAMLLEGECGGLGPTAAAHKYDYTKQRYLQLRTLFLAQGTLGLQDLPRGPKTDYRRTDELVRQVIRYRFLDPDTSVAVIAQKLQQAHYPIGIRSVERVIADYGLQKKGFEVANGLPFVASDPEIHTWLDGHTVREAEALQIALGKLRRASGHFGGQLLAIDPHRLQSYTQRQTRRHRQDTRTKAFKVLQTFFCLDAHTGQPLGFHLSSAARTVAQATPPLLLLAQAILNVTPDQPRPLVLADCEPYDHHIVDPVRLQTPFDLLIPMPQRRGLQAPCAALPESAFTRRWAGYATAKQPWTLRDSTTGPGYHLIQRSGETPGQYFYKSFFATGDRPELADLNAGSWPPCP